MRRRIGTQARFFLAVVLVCLALVPAMPDAFRWVDWGSAGLAAFWAVMFALEDFIGTPASEDVPRASMRAAIPEESETPFAPPPPPRRRGG